MHFALQQTCPQAEVVAAFEINELANDVYQANFAFRPRQVSNMSHQKALLCQLGLYLHQRACCLRPAASVGLQCCTILLQCLCVTQGNIGALSGKLLDGFAADLWLLAPPCQPYTRRGHKRAAEDPRASSFLHLLCLLPQLRVRTLQALII